ncbi:MAG: hydrogenase maturation protease [Anaerolineae bacterium]|nr:hydrogenase maturation protease [Anaerolineae bacterium]
MRTLVIGLGNPILRDDGVGVRVAETVRGLLPPDVPVDVRETALGGLTLMEFMVGYDRVILVDALQRESGVPGTLHRWTLDDLRSVSPTQHAASPHDATLLTALEVGRRMGLRLPEEVIIYAIDVEDVLDFGEELTPAVAAVIPKAADAILAELCGIREAEKRGTSGGKARM